MKIIKAILLLTIITNGINAQNKRAFMLGVNPSFTVEQYYDEGELDINIFPLTVQVSMSKRIDIRFITLLNVGIREDASGFSQMGIESALPIFFKAKEDLIKQSFGFYAAPVISLSKSKIDDNVHFGLWAEPGYQFGIGERFSMVCGIQAGTTYIYYDSGEASWNSHFGLKVILGWWM